MRAFYDLLNSLARLTGVRLFRDIANLFYKADQTKRQLDNVKRNYDRVKNQGKNKK